MYLSDAVIPKELNNMKTETRKQIGKINSDKSNKHNNIMNDVIIHTICKNKLVLIERQQLT